ncbi:MAG: PD-(D/E)XK nuclease family protein [Fimbriimonadaceae bacterium]
MPQKPKLSPTKISTYLACALKYRWTYVHPHRWLIRDKHYYSFGQSLHTVLERVFEGKSLEIPMEELDALYEESWIEAGYSSSEAMQEAYGEGKELIEKYVEREKAIPKLEGKTIAVERTFKKELNDFVLVGRVDRLVEGPDGTLEIVDYKSRRRGVSSEDVANDLAMGCYQLLVKEAFPGKKVQARIIALAAEEEASYSLSESEHELLESDLNKLGHQILGTDWFEAESEYKPICRTCDFSSLCLKGPQFKIRWEQDQSVSANS